MNLSEGNGNSLKPNNQRALLSEGEHPHTIFYLLSYLWKRIHKKIRFHPSSSKQPGITTILDLAR